MNLNNLTQFLKIHRKKSAASLLMFLFVYLYKSQKYQYFMSKIMDFMNTKMQKYIEKQLEKQQEIQKKVQILDEIKMSYDQINFSSFFNQITIIQNIQNSLKKETDKANKLRYWRQLLIEILSFSLTYLLTINLIKFMKYLELSLNLENKEIINDIIIKSLNDINIQIQLFVKKQNYQVTQQFELNQIWKLFNLEELSQNYQYELKIQKRQNTFKTFFKNFLNLFEYELNLPKEINSIQKVFLTKLQDSLPADPLMPVYLEWMHSDNFNIYLEQSQKYQFQSFYNRMKLNFIKSNKDDKMILANYLTLIQRIITEEFMFQNSEQKVQFYKARVKLAMVQTQDQENEEQPATDSELEFNQILIEEYIQFLKLKEFHSQLEQIINDQELEEKKDNNLFDKFINQ